jgi:hypothetical protein
MRRSASIFAGVAIAAALVGILVKFGRPAAVGARPSADPVASAEPEIPAPEGSSVVLPAGQAPPTPELEVAWTTDGGANLPANAPGNVGFGVVLFTYQGAQYAPQNARSKSEALEKAKGVIEEAKKDFAAAVKKGDHGSTADAGHIPRGVVEPEIETVLFTLEKGAVHPLPLDTPRGYWVVRRND